MLIELKCTYFEFELKHRILEREVNIYQLAKTHRRKILFSSTIFHFINPGDI